MTSLATHPQDPDQLDLLSLVADEHTPLEVEHFPEPCAVGGHGPVWCAECMERWPCPGAAS